MTEREEYKRQFKNGGWGVGKWRIEDGKGDGQQWHEGKNGASDYDSAPVFKEPRSSTEDIYKPL